MEVPTIYKAYIRPKFQGISPENMALYGTNVPPFQDPEIPTGAAQIRQKVGKNAGAWGI